MGCECGGCQRGAEAIPVKLRFFPLGSSHGLRCVFAGTGVKTVSPNENHSWWESEPHNTPIGETNIFYPEIHPIVIKKMYVSYKNRINYEKKDIRKDF